MPRYGGDGRKASHCFSRAKEDEISDRDVFKNELEEGRNSGKICGGVIGRAFEDQIYFLNYRYEYIDACLPWKMFPSNMILSFFNNLTVSLGRIPFFYLSISSKSLGLTIFVL